MTTLLTKEGLLKFKNEQMALLSKRKEVLVSLVKAREMGDLSENGAYKGARFELGNVDRRLRYLQSLLKNANVIKARSLESIGLGNKVNLEVNGEKIAYTIVSEHETNPKEGYISNLSPVGIKLIGKKVGDKFDIEVNGKSSQYEVKKIV